MSGAWCEQLSLFSLGNMTTSATCLFNMESREARKPDEWMSGLVPGGKYVVDIDSHPLVLRPVNLRENEVPAGHRFYHYLIGNQVYAGVFVGKSAAEKEVDDNG